MLNLTNYIKKKYFRLKVSIFKNFKQFIFNYNNLILNLLKKIITFLLIDKIYVIKIINIKDKL